MVQGIHSSTLNEGFSGRLKANNGKLGQEFCVVNATEVKRCVNYLHPWLQKLQSLSSHIIPLEVRSRKSHRMSSFEARLLLVPRKGAVRVEGWWLAKTFSGAHGIQKHVFWTSTVRKVLVFLWSRCFCTKDIPNLFQAFVDVPIRCQDYCIITQPHTAPNTPLLNALGSSATLRKRLATKSEEFFWPVMTNFDQLCFCSIPTQSMLLNLVSVSPVQHVQVIVHQATSWCQDLYHDISTNIYQHPSAISTKTSILTVSFFSRDPVS